MNDHFCSCHAKTIVAYVNAKASSVTPTYQNVALIITTGVFPIRYTISVKCKHTNATRDFSRACLFPKKMMKATLASSKRRSFKASTENSYSSCCCSPWGDVNKTYISSHSLSPSSTALPKLLHFAI